MKVQDGRHQKAGGNILERIQPNECHVVIVMWQNLRVLQIPLLHLFF